MKTRITVFTGLLLGAASLLLAHDLFIKLDSYFLAPNSTVRVPILNGTFSVSEGSVARNRVMDITVVSPTGRLQIDTTNWIAENDTTFLQIRTGDGGTYVVGASTRPNLIELEAEDFNRYLELDGIPDVLEQRRKNNELDKAARERYHKHVKAVFQVGDTRTETYSTVLGYPAEIVPLENPYTLSVDETLRVRALVDGNPVANQLMIAGGENDGEVIEERSTRTDADGVARFTVDSPGRWYVKFINMSPSPEEDLDYESKWATLTFEIRR
jgi:hypothetical protein